MPLNWKVEAKERDKKQGKIKLNVAYISRFGGDIFGLDGLSLWGMILRV